MALIKKTIIMLALIAIPILGIAQPQSCKVTYGGKQPTIKDFARAYCSQFDNDSFERQALAAFMSGNSKSTLSSSANERIAGGCTDCIVDTRNGYMKYIAHTGGNIIALEICYWNCNNKNEKLVAINTIDSSMGFDDSSLTFYRYNAKNKKMRHIDAPFYRTPHPIDLIDQSKADQKTIEMVLNSHNEDACKFQPAYILPRSGKDIICRMADPNAVPREFQRECKLSWDGDGFGLPD